MTDNHDITGAPVEAPALPNAPASTPTQEQEPEVEFDLSTLRMNCTFCPYFRPYNGMVGWWGAIGRCNALHGLADGKKWLPFPWQKLARHILARIAWSEMTDHCEYRGRAEAKDISYDYGGK